MKWTVLWHHLHLHPCSWTHLGNMSDPNGFALQTRALPGKVWVWIGNVSRILFGWCYFLHWGSGNTGEIDDPWAVLNWLGLGPCIFTFTLGLRTQHTIAKRKGDIPKRGKDKFLQGHHVFAKSTLSKRSIFVKAVGSSCHTFSLMLYTLDKCRIFIAYQVDNIVCYYYCHIISVIVIHYHYHYHYHYHHY